MHQATRVYCTDSVGGTSNHDDDLLMDSYSMDTTTTTTTYCANDVVSHISDVVPIEAKPFPVWTYHTVPRLTYQLQ